jgi:hypothetical protein
MSVAILDVQIDHKPRGSSYAATLGACRAEAVGRIEKSFVSTPLGTKLSYVVLEAICSTRRYAYYAAVLRQALALCRANVCVVLRATERVAPATYAGRV